MELIPKLETLRDGRPKTWLAKKIEVSTHTVTSWERGETYPDYRQSRKIARLYGVSMEDLYEEKENQPE